MRCSSDDALGKITKLKIIMALKIITFRVKKW